MLLYWYDFNILDISHITSGITMQMKIVWLNWQIFLNFLKFLELVRKLSYGFVQSSTTFL